MAAWTLPFAAVAVICAATFLLPTSASGLLTPDKSNSAAAFAEALAGSIAVWPTSADLLHTNSSSSTDEEALRRKFPWPPLPIHQLIEIIRFMLREWALALSGSALTCAEDIIAIADAAIDQKSADAFNILDALGKPKTGLQRGAILWLGDYDMCYAVEQFKVHYCLARVGPTANEYNFTAKSLQRTLGLGVCVPERCSAKDLDAVMNLYIHHVPDAQKLGMKVYGTQCDLPPPWDAPTIAVFVVFGAFILLSLVATMVVKLLHQHRHTSLSPDSLVTQQELSTTRVRRVNSETLVVENNTTTTTIEGRQRQHAATTASDMPTVIAFCSLFDPLTNIQKIMSPLPGNHLDNMLGVVDGLRTLSMCWVVVYFVFFMSRLFFSNPLDLVEHESNYFLFQIVFGSTFALDTFLLLSGLKFALRMFGRHFAHGKFGVNFLWYFVHRWIGLMPLYGAFLVFFIYIIPHLVTGPFPAVILQEVGNPIENCHAYWWTNLLFINNYYPVQWSDKCLDWTSYIALEVQLFLLSPLLIFLIAKLPIIGWLTSLALIAGPIIARTLLSLHFGLPITWDQAQIESRRTESVYNSDVDYTQFAIYTRADSYIIGILCAYILARYARKQPNRHGAWHLNRLLGLVMWLVLGALAAFAIFSTSGQNYADAMGLTARAIWFALARPAFALYVAWIIVATIQFGAGGPIGALLGHSLFRPLARVTFAVFLFYVAAVQFILANQRDTFYFHDVNMIALTILLLIGAYAGGLTLSVLFEAPFRRLERMLRNAVSSGGGRSAWLGESVGEPTWDELADDGDDDAPINFERYERELRQQHNRNVVPIKTTVINE